MSKTYNIFDTVIISYHTQKYKRVIMNIHKIYNEKTNEVKLEYEVDLHVGLIAGNNRFISEDDIVCLATTEHRDYVM